MHDTPRTRRQFCSQAFQAVSATALRRFGVGLDTSLLEAASMGRVRTAMAARRARREATEGRD